MASNCSDSGESDASRVSIRDLKSAVGASRRGQIKGESASVRLTIGECAVEIEKERTSGRWAPSLLTDFRRLCGEGRHRDGLMQCLDSNSIKTPNKLQEYLIPLFLHFLGKELDGRQLYVPRSCMLVQGPASGKTTSAVLAILAAIDPAIQQPQAIFVSRSAELFVNKLLTVFASMQTFTFQAFDRDEVGANGGFDTTSPELVAACTAHILIGHPGRMRKVLTSETSIALDRVKVLVVDDSLELFNGASHEADRSQSQQVSKICVTGLPSGEIRQPVEATSLTSPIEDVVEICKILDAHEHACNGIATKVQYIILADQSADKASRKMLKLLRSSMMTKKDLLSVEICMVPTKAIKNMKHYYAEAASSGWVSVFAGLVQGLAFPRALIYCDDERIHKYFNEMQALGIKVGANLPGATSALRQEALQDFSMNKTQFLLTHSEPAVCHIMLPKVSCVFHFGILSEVPSVYGVRLKPIEEKLRKECSSILLVDAQKSSKASEVHPVVSKLQKLFHISFMDMPLELLPSGQSSTCARVRA